MSDFLVIMVLGGAVFFYFGWLAWAAFPGGSTARGVAAFCSLVGAIQMIISFFALVTWVVVS